MTTQQFTAQISTSGTRTVILLPFDPNVVWGEKARHHVRGTINGKMIRGELDQDGDNYFIALGPAWQRDNGLRTGTAVEVTLFPEGPLSNNVASDVAAALDAAPQAKVFFDALPTFYRNNYIRWIESAKRDTTRAKRIQEMVELLNAGKRER